MTSVSLCMIVKNEEAVLGRCLACVAGFVDEIVIIDTGSTDRTKEVARQYTEKVYDFSWQDDFASARNFAFSKGRGEYLFWLDADDVILEGELEKLKELKVRLTAEKPDFVMLLYAVGFDEQGRPSFTFYRERLIRRCERAVWRGRVHEAVVPFGTIWKEEIVIEHRKEKAPDSGRNLRIFEKMRTDGESFGAREQYYYGKELYYHRRYKEAVRELENFLERPDGWKENKLDACRHLAKCRYGLSENGEAIKALFNGLQYGIPRPELCCDIGSWFLERQEFVEAAYWYRQALKNRKQGSTDGFIQEELRGYVPCLQLCVCYDRLGKKRLAEQFNRLAERFKPGTKACEHNRRYFEEGRK
ncbi:MAG: glycosyltransferase family 2 protein [Lachnospiraceae bacterium]|nr:glycosyltransferase family 2 protein [Lachnospiraceae bacterium]